MATPTVQTLENFMLSMLFVIREKNSIYKRLKKDFVVLNICLSSVMLVVLVKFSKKLAFFFISQSQHALLYFEGEI